MLPKQHRLPLRTELKRVQKEGKLIHGQLFSLLIAKQPAINNQHSPRFGFIISSRVHKKAVKRNRAKRLLSEGIRSLLPRIKLGFDTVFLAKKGVIDKELIEIQAEIERIFRRGGVIEGESQSISPPAGGLEKESQGQNI